VHPYICNTYMHTPYKSCIYILCILSTVTFRFYTLLHRFRYGGLLYCTSIMIVPKANADLWVNYRPRNSCNVRIILSGRSMRLSQNAAGILSLRSTGIQGICKQKPYDFQRPILSFLCSNSISRISGTVDGIVHYRVGEKKGYVLQSCLITKVWTMSR
jgi:hypothetical protein